MIKQDQNAINALESFVPGGWETIRQVQQGTYQRGFIDTSKPRKNPATDRDRELLAKHGEQGLRDLSLYGVLDRLNLPFE